MIPVVRPRRWNAVFPPQEHAIVAEEKIRDYLLNPGHPVGGAKAIWFASIGYTRATDELVDDLLRLARTAEQLRGQVVAVPA